MRFLKSDVRLPKQLTTADSPFYRIRIGTLVKQMSSWMWTDYDDWSALSHDARVDFMKKLLPVFADIMRKLETLVERKDDPVEVMMARCFLNCWENDSERLVENHSKAVKSIVGVEIWLRPQNRRMADQAHSFIAIVTRVRDCRLAAKSENRMACAKGLTAVQSRHADLVKRRKEWEHIRRLRKQREEAELGTLLVGMEIDDAKQVAVENELSSLLVGMEVDGDDEKSRSSSTANVSNANITPSTFPPTLLPTNIVGTATMDCTLNFRTTRSGTAISSAPYYHNTTATNTDLDATATVTVQGNPQSPLINDDGNFDMASQLSTLSIGREGQANSTPSETTAAQIKNHGPYTFKSKAQRRKEPAQACKNSKDKRLDASKTIQEQVHGDADAVLVVGRYSEKSV